MTIYGHNDFFSINVVLSRQNTWPRANIGVLTCNSSKITVKTMKSSVRRIKASIARAHTRRTEGTFGRMELDSHADTIVAGANCVVL